MGLFSSEIPTHPSIRFSIIFLETCTTENPYPKKKKKNPKEEKNPSWVLTHPPTSEFFLFVRHALICNRGCCKQRHIHIGAVQENKPRADSSSLGVKGLTINSQLI